MDDELPELERRVDGRYSWNPRFGEKYFLGSINETIVGVGWLDCKETFATFMGYHIEDDKFVFFREERGKLFRYSVSPSLPAVWHSDGEDDPSCPVFKAFFDYEVSEGPTKDYILERLAYHTERHSKNKKVA